jgi:hypothetical protein
VISRYSPRKNERSRVTVTINGLVGDGVLLNLSVPGALIETSLPLLTGQFVALGLSLNTHRIRVDLAAVRWVNGKRAGLEFIRMSQLDQICLKWYVGFVERERTRCSNCAEMAKQ